MRPFDDLRTRLASPSTYLLWAFVLLLQAATFILLLDVLAQGRPEVLLGEVPPQAPFGPLFSSPLTWLTLLVVLPALALGAESFWGALLTWVAMWLPAWILVVVLQVLGLDAPWGPLLAGGVGWLGASVLLLALAWTVSRLLARGLGNGTAWGRAVRVVVTWLTPFLVVLALAAQGVPQSWDLVEQSRLFGRGVLPLSTLIVWLGVSGALLVVSRGRGVARPWRTVLVLIVVTAVGVLFAPRGDWTPGQLYRLDATSVETLAEVDLPVDLRLVVDRRDAIAPYARELVQRVARRSPEVVVRETGPEASTESLPAAGSITLTTTYGERALGLDELVGRDEGEVTLHVEAALMTALDELTGRAPRVALAEGHGELSLSGSSDETGPRENLLLLAALLARQGVRVDSWDDASQRPDLLLIAGPRMAWPGEDRRRLDSFVRQGGAVWLLLDPRFDASGTGAQLDLGLEDWLATLGVEVGRDVVVDPAGRLDAVGPETFTLRRFADHPAVRTLAGVAPEQPAVLSLARSVGRAVGRAVTVPNGVEVTELLHTSRLGWGETSPAGSSEVGAQLDDTDRAGPVPLAVAVETAPEGRFRGGRLLVYGDATWVNDALLSRGANAQLARTSLAWLLRRGEALDIAPTRFTVPRWDAGRHARPLGWVFTLLLVASLVAALVTWRRKRVR